MNFYLLNVVIGIASLCGSVVVSRCVMCDCVCVCPVCVICIMYRRVCVCVTAIEALALTHRHAVQSELSRRSRRRCIE